MWYRYLEVKIHIIIYVILVKTKTLSKNFFEYKLNE